jgi:hypothetical protein
VTVSARATSTPANSEPMPSWLSVSGTSKTKSWCPAFSLPVRSTTTVALPSMMENGVDATGPSRWSMTSSTRPSASAPLVNENVTVCCSPKVTEVEGLWTAR